MSMSNMSDPLNTDMSYEIDSNVQPLDCSFAPSTFDTSDSTVFLEVGEDTGDLHQPLNRSFYSMTTVQIDDTESGPDILDDTDIVSYPEFSRDLYNSLCETDVDSSYEIQSTLDYSQNDSLNLGESLLQINCPTVMIHDQEISVCLYVDPRHAAGLISAPVSTDRTASETSM